MQKLTIIGEQEEEELKCDASDGGDDDGVSITDSPCPKTRRHKQAIMDFSAMMPAMVARDEESSASPD